MNQCRVLPSIQHYIRYQQWTYSAVCFRCRRSERRRECHVVRGRVLLDAKQNIYRATCPCKHEQISSHRDRCSDREKEITHVRTFCSVRWELTWPLCYTELACTLCLTILEAECAFGCQNLRGCIWNSRIWPDRWWFSRAKGDTRNLTILGTSYVDIKNETCVLVETFLAVESRQSYLSSDKSLVEYATYVDRCDASAQ